jgi:hypothetical protein
MPRSPSIEPPERPRLFGLLPRSRARPPHAPLPGALPARPRPSGLPPRCPWRCASAHCAACSRAASLVSLSSLSLSSSIETELSVLLTRRCSSSRHCCFYLYPCCCQFRHHQPCRPCRRHCSLCCRSLTFLCRGNLGLLPVLRTRGDRALRPSFGHGVLVGGCYVGKRLPQMSCCLSV